ncbi:MAG: CDP-diacylglycerol--serine O-phosphatidyltransferase [Desulfobacteraceae bacterium]|nr:CDP-diacylglycerol--serine O-phosphatidyltransferase [Desulfobacteraceae bacterium]
MRRNKRKRFKKEKFKRGIYLLPNLFTAANMFCGFYAAIASINGNFVAAAYAILVAGIFDNLDGKVARATHTTSKFGVEFDSLADLISFGMAPGLMMFLWVLNPLGRVGWLAAFLFLICGALRLARFNTQSGSVNSNYFIGLPIPAGAGMTAATVLFCHRLNLQSMVHPFLFLILLYFLSFLMVSTIPYYSFKKAELFRNKNFNALVASILVFVFIAAQPSIAVFLIGSIYIMSGPINGVRHYKLKRRQAETESVQEKEQRTSHL